MARRASKRVGAQRSSPVTEAERWPDVARRLLRWFGGRGGRVVARELPWRTGPAGQRDPYLVLVSEAMLQQTQVSRVLERFPRFISRFPTVHALAAADERDVLAEWSGMGYYRRAKNLHAAARVICTQHGGEVPRSVEALRELPGVGRYTAGAVASIAFGDPAPIVDGNVARVILRIDGRDAAADDRSVQRWLWDQATTLAGATAHPGIVNEALMELGATVCVPSPNAPRCERCPLADLCVARAQGRQLQIPRAKARARQKRLYCGSVVVRRADGCVLVEQRGPTGMWAGLWQAPTVERMDQPVVAADLAGAVGLPARALKPESSFEHQTTHRRVVFQVWRAEVARGFQLPSKSPGVPGISQHAVWMNAARIERLGLSNPQRRILLEAVGGGTLWS